MSIKTIIYSHPLTSTIIAGVLVVAILFAISSFSEDIGGWLASRKIAQQDAIILKAKEDNLKLEGEKAALAAQLSTVNTQLEAVNSQLAVAIETSKYAKTNYIEVRSGSRPVFNSPDISGKRAELESALDKLYPDNPNKR